MPVVGPIGIPGFVSIGQRPAVTVGSHSAPPPNIHPHHRDAHRFFRHWSKGKEHRVLSASGVPETTGDAGVVRSLIPARIDRLPWSSFHTKLVMALGVAWILDGLEITLASVVSDALTKPETLDL